MRWKTQRTDACLGRRAWHNADMRTAILAAALLAAPVVAADTAPAYPPTPSEIVAAAAPSDWVAIDPADLLVMILAPDASGRERKVVIQLIAEPFSQPWVANIRTLAKAHWWDGLAIVRAQDNYVVQWGDPDAEDAKKARPLPTGLEPTNEKDYTATPPEGLMSAAIAFSGRKLVTQPLPGKSPWRAPLIGNDPYAHYATFQSGFPIAGVQYPDAASDWPVHCYGTVGVGRDLSPSAGTGAELYTVIGHAPRHLDRNIAVVGRVIEGIENLSTLPRGTEALGFYATPRERTGIVSVRLASDLPRVERPAFEYLSTESATFARYADARANRHDPFFIVPAGGVDVCNVPVPVRRAGAAK